MLSLKEIAAGTVPNPYIDVQKVDIKLIDDWEKLANLIELKLREKKQISNIINEAVKMCFDEHMTEINIDSRRFFLTKTTELCVYIENLINGRYNNFPEEMTIRSKKVLVDYNNTRKNYENNQGWIQKMTF